MTSALNWVESEGGPLILMEEPLLKSWKGSFSPSNHSAGVSGLPGNGDSFQKVRPDSNGGKITDYDRACGVDDYLGMIAVGPGLALVLGDEPMRTAWWPLPENGGVLVRWHWANDEGSVIKALCNSPEAIWQSSDLVFPVSGNPLILFDSAFAGSDIEGGFEINLPEGLYSVETARHQPNQETSLLLHRLTSRDQ